jgi:hypothetical protein
VFREPGWNRIVSGGSSLFLESPITSREWMKGNHGSPKCRRILCVSASAVAPECPNLLWGMIQQVFYTNACFIIMAGADVTLNKRQW